MPPKDKPHLNLIVIGHADAGKSTTTGHLMFKSGSIDKKLIDRYEKECEESGKNNNGLKFAWVLDQLQAERERGITIDISLSKFQTKKYLYTIIDAPGHRDFIKNMITGTTQSDIALLVIPAIPDEFKIAYDKNGQTREHALLASTMGVKQIIVAINKMDDKTVNYSEEQYNKIKIEITNFLKKLGYKTDNDAIPFIPISAINGDNIGNDKSSNMLWYTGPTLLEILDKVIPPKRPTDLPLRIPVQDVFKVGGIGTVTVGRIETGILKPGMNVVFSPSGLSSEVGTLEMHHESVELGEPGDHIGFTVPSIVSSTDIKRGDVVGDSNNDPPRAVESFEAQIMILEHPNRILTGYSPVIDCHTSHVACRFNRLIARVSKRGEIEELDPKFITSGQSCIAELVPMKAMTVESYSKYAPLGRFSVRDMRKTVAVGMIKSTKRKNNDGTVTISGGKEDGKIISGTALLDKKSLKEIQAKLHAKTNNNNNTTESSNATASAPSSSSS